MYNSSQNGGTRNFSKGHQQCDAECCAQQNMGQMLNNPDEITEHVHEAFEQQARPTNGRTQTKGNQSWPV